MKRIPFGGLKPNGADKFLISLVRDNEINPLRGIDLTPRPPSLRGKGENLGGGGVLPSVHRGGGWGRG
jgi:hypothetical protein